MGFGLNFLGLRKGSGQQSPGTNSNYFVGLSRGGRFKPEMEKMQLADRDHKRDPPTHLCMCPTASSAWEKAGKTKRKGGENEKMGGDTYH